MLIVDLIMVMFLVLLVYEKYNRTGAFTITNVEHTISQMMWTTSIEEKFRQVNNG